MLLWKSKKCYLDQRYAWLWKLSSFSATLYGHSPKPTKQIPFNLAGPPLASIISVIITNIANV